MKLININSKFYKVPTNWYDINLKQFLAIRSLKEKTDNNDSEIDFLINFTSIITNIPKDELEKLTPTEFGSLMADLMIIASSNIPEENGINFKINGKNYIFDSSLDNINYGQFIDLDYITKNKEFWEVAHKVCAIFVRPEKKSKLKYLKRLFKKNNKITSKDYLIEEYNFETMESRSKLFFETIPMPYVLSVANFFSNLGENLQKSIQAYSQK